MEKVLKQSDIQKIWSYIGRNRKFTLDDLCLITDLESSTVVEICVLFEKAGYLKADVSEEVKCYRCANYTGKLTPIFTAGGEVTDPNLEHKKRQREKTTHVVRVIKTIVDYPKEPFCRQEIEHASKEEYDLVSRIMNQMHHSGVLELYNVGKKNTLYYKLNKEVKAFCEICGASWADLVREVVDVR